MAFARVSAAVLKILLGMMFIVSAVSKFVSIDTFEIYIFSFALLPLNVCFFVARLVIALELLLGVALISNRHHRFTVLMAFLFLVVFLVFLAFAHLGGRTDSCHCFGELLPLSPVQSILKNALLVLLLLFVFKFSPREWSPRWWLVIVIYLLTAAIVLLYTIKALHLVNFLSIVMILVMMCAAVLASFAFFSRWYVTAALVLTPLVTTFILTPPDNWLFGGTDEHFDKQLFLTHAGVVCDEHDGTDVDGRELNDYGLDQGRHIVAFFSPGCQYCRLAAGKLSTIIERHDIDSSSVLYVFPSVADTSRYASFYNESRSHRYCEAKVGKELFIRITRAAFPLVVLLDEDSVVASFAYRNIDERIISDFMLAQ